MFTNTLWRLTVREKPSPFALPCFSFLPWPCYHDTVRATCSERGCHGNPVANSILGSFWARWLLRVVCCWCSALLIIVWREWNSTWSCCAIFVVRSFVSLGKAERVNWKEYTRKKKKKRKQGRETVRFACNDLVQRRKQKSTVS